MPTTRAASVAIFCQNIRLAEQKGLSLASQWLGEGGEQDSRRPIKRTSLVSLRAMKIPSPTAQVSEGQRSLENPIRRWGRVPDAIEEFALSRTKLHQLIAAGKIVSVSMREPGQRKATRLICLNSLGEYIESFIPTTEGKGEPEA